MHQTPAPTAGRMPFKFKGGPSPSTVGSSLGENRGVEGRKKRGEGSRRTAGGQMWRGSQMLRYSTALLGSWPGSRQGFSGQRYVSSFEPAPRTTHHSGCEAQPQGIWHRASSLTASVTFLWSKLSMNLYIYNYRTKSCSHLHLSSPLAYTI